MIRTMQLVAQLANKRAVRRFPLQFRKNGLTYSREFIAGITSGCRSPAFADSDRPWGIMLGARNGRPVKL